MMIVLSSSTFSENENEWVGINVPPNPGPAVCVVPSLIKNGAGLDYKKHSLSDSLGPFGLSDSFLSSLLISLRSTFGDGGEDLFDFDLPLPGLFMFIRASFQRLNMGLDH